MNAPGKGAEPAGIGGESRLACHGIDAIAPGSSVRLAGWLPEGGRINLTLRRVTRLVG